MSAPLCLCDPPESSVKAVAGQSSKHAGREFWSCRICDFFQWVDQGGTTLSAAGPPCRCGHPSHLRITRKAGSNCGRSFWTCANTGAYSYGFFQWESADWEAPTDSQSSSTESATEDQSCKKCGKSVKVMTVSENNQKGNGGGGAVVDFLPMDDSKMAWQRNPASFSIVVFCRTTGGSTTLRWSLAIE